MMSHIPRSIRAYLEDQRIPYEVVDHPRDYTAQETAHHTHTPGRAFAKTVILWIDGDYAMIVIPADHQVDLEQVRQALGARTINLATEEEVRALCADCEVGAMPPFGPLYAMPMYIVAELAANELITFNAGTHTSAIRMRYADFEQLVAPQEITFSRQVGL